MIALFCLCLSLFASPFKSKSRLEAENAALRYQLIVLKRRVRGRVQLTNGGSPVLGPVVSMVSIGPQGHHDHPARDPGAMASSWLPSVLALEIPLPWRPIANRRGAARADPADERRITIIAESNFQYRQPAPLIQSRDPPDDADRI